MEIQTEEQLAQIQQALEISELRYRRLFECAQDGILILDFDSGMILDVNPYLINMLGYSKEEFLSRALWEVSPFRDTQLNKESFLKLQREGFVRYENLPLETADGISIDVEFVSNSYPINGQIFIQCNIRDISKRMQAKRDKEDMEEYFKLIFFQSPAPTVIVNIDGSFKEVNAKMCDLLGYSRNELVGKHFLDITHPCHYEQDKNSIEGLILGEATIYKTQKRYIHKSGKIIWANIVVNLIRDQNGEPIHFVSILEDITENKKIKENLAEKETQFKNLVENANNIILGMDLTGKLTFINQFGAKFFGFGASQLIGKSVVGTIVPPRESTGRDLKDLIDRICKDPEEYKKNINENICQNGERVWVSWNNNAQRSSDGNLLEIFCIGSDITEQKRAAEYIKIRLDLLDFSNQHTLEELLQESLDQICKITQSQIGFYHFINEDEKTIALQAWSTKTLELFCQADKREQHYPLDQGGVWTDAVKTKKPTIHNCYEDLPNRKGMPEGHAKVIRELIVPILRLDKVVAILGVGNKQDPYTEQDVEIVSYLADVAWEITIRKRAEQSRKESEQIFYTAFESSPLPMTIVSEAGVYLDVNKGFIKTFGHQLEDVIGKTSVDINLFVDLADRTQIRSEVKSKGMVYNIPMSGRTRSGKILNCLTSSCSIEVAGEFCYLTSIVDITELKLLQDQFAQAQKLESIGTLAGGIAHDFNNLLQIILGYTEMLLGRSDLSDKIKQDLTKIEHAGQSGADLVQRLLAFSRKTEINPVDLNINDSVKQVEKLLEHTLPRMIKMKTILQEDLKNIHADPVQIEQVIMNLAVNARDAMGQGGLLLIETSNVVLDKEYCKLHLDCKDGNYILLKISDTGCGMKKEILDRIFEPFFTTKKKDKGSGLGLAQVFGTIKQHKGTITCYSEPGHGSVFNIYLPCSNQDQTKIIEVPNNLIQTGNETILIVDDEEPIREWTRRILEKQGYKTMVAQNGKEALTIYKQNKDLIDLILLDLIMPELGGEECLKKLIHQYPDVKVIIASGYSNNGGPARKAARRGARGFVEKPFDQKTILRQVRKVLDE